MFKRDKGVKEYMNAIEKVKIPSIKGEEYITKNNKTYKSKIKISSIMITAASLCVIFLVTTFGSNLLLNKDVANEKIPFAITAYAGTQEVKLEENRKIDLPSGFIKDGVFNMQGLYIEGDDIEKIVVKFDSGNIAYGATKNIKEPLMQTVSISDGGSRIEGRTKKTNKQGMTVRYTNDMATDDQSSINSQEINQNDVNEEEIEEVPNGVVYDCCVGMTDGTDEDFEIENEFGYSKHYITWIPEREFLKKLCTNSIDDFSKEQGCVMNITITFKDGTTLEETLNLTFGKAGNLIVELK